MGHSCSKFKKHNINLFFYDWIGYVNSIIKGYLVFISRSWGRSCGWCRTFISSSRWWSCANSSCRLRISRSTLLKTTWTGIWFCATASRRSIVSRWRKRNPIRTLSSFTTVWWEYRMILLISSSYFSKKTMYTQEEIITPICRVQE